MQEISVIHPSINEYHLGESKIYHNLENESGERYERDVFTRIIGKFFRKSENRLLWGVYGQDILDEWNSDLEDFFNSESSGTSEDLIDYIHQNFDDTANILELAGPGEFIRQLGMNSKSLAVTLGDGRNKQQAEYDKEHSIDLLTIDLITDRGHPDSNLGGWDDINIWMNNEGVESFDIIASYPIAGWSNIPHNLGIYKELSNRVFPKLSVNGLFILRGASSREIFENNRVFTWLVRDCEGEYTHNFDGSTLVVKRVA